MLHLSDVAAHQFPGLYGKFSPLPPAFSDGRLTGLAGRIRRSLFRLIARSFALPACTPPRRPGTAHPWFKACHYR